MLKTTMEQQEDGRYMVELYADGVLVATPSEPLPLKRAVSWCDRAAVDYRLAEVRMCGVAA